MKPIDFIKIAIKDCNNRQKVLRLSEYDIIIPWIPNEVTETSKGIVIEFLQGCERQMYGLQIL